MVTMIKFLQGRRMLITNISSFEKKNLFKIVLKLNITKTLSERMLRYFRNLYTHTYTYFFSEFELRKPLINIFFFFGHQVNVAMQNKVAHMNGSDVTCLKFSYDGRTLASRGGM